MRSRTGCLTCRARKIRCDERKPVCGQCVKGKRTCAQGAAVAFRHQQNASMNGADRADGPASRSLKSFFAYRQTFHDDHIWLTIPPKVTFVHVQDPYADDPEPLNDLASSATSFPRAEAFAATWAESLSPTSAVAAVTGVTTSSIGTPAVIAMSKVNLGGHGLDVLSAAASGSSPFMSSISPAATSVASGVGGDESDQPRSVYALSPQGTSSNASRKRGRGADDGTEMQLDSPMRPPSDMFRTPSSNMKSSGTKSVGEVETDPEVAFLLRHYSEAPGFGMDLFDCGRYFSMHVPIKARSNALLKNAACAYAAKHLGRVDGLKFVYGGNCSQLASMEIWPGLDSPDWTWHACKYYDRALELVLEALGSQPTGAADGMDGEDAAKRARRSGSADEALAAAATTDELLAATAILCEYEAMDMSDAAWSRHLNGTKSLLDIAELGMRPAADYAILGPELDTTRLFAGSRKAIFWNFARQDLISAFITQCQTRLDVHNFAMWRAAGLNVDAHGRLVHGASLVDRYGNDNHSREDMTANSLIWILMRLNNYLTAGENLTAIPGEHVEDTLPLDGGAGAIDGTEDPSGLLPSPSMLGGSTGGTRLGVSQQTLLGRWRRIDRELNEWHASLPESFRPVARIPHPVFSETWYSMNMVASAMQHYHMGKILLLINKPHETTVRRTTVTTRLKSYNSIAAEIRRHCEEICSISLSRIEGSGRVFSIQPLFVAGQCLTEVRERQVILELLRGIEKDLGWATEWRIQELLQEWHGEDMD